MDHSSFFTHSVSLSFIFFLRSTHHTVYASQSLPQFGISCMDNEEETEGAQASSKHTFICGFSFECGLTELP